MKLKIVLFPGIEREERVSGTKVLRYKGSMVQRLISDSYQGAWLGTQIITELTFRVFGTIL